MSQGGDRPTLVALLAAGLARRFGGGKLDADLAGKPVGSRALETIARAGLPPGIIVVGPQAPQFAQQAVGWTLRENSDPASGLGTSVAIAAREAAARGADLLLALADMPLVTHDHILALIRDGKTSATAYPEGRLGVPAFVTADSLVGLSSLDGERGAGPLLEQLKPRAIAPVEDRILLDVDDPEDLVRARALIGYSGRLSK